MEERIECWNCGKLFAMKKRGFVLATPSTEIEFIPDDKVVVEIKCPRNDCHKRTTLIFK